MGGRGTFAAGNNVDYKYEVDRSFSDSGKWKGVKILKGKDGSGQHGLPESSHSSSAYIKLDRNGIFREIRFYDQNHCLYLEIAYHKELSLVGNNHIPVLHYHTYDTSFSKDRNAPIIRSAALPLSDAMMEKYKKYFKGVTIND